ncbi:DUF6247 family protein [Streptomyces sp. NPDC097619]|uniref:DUF6247 family protein n=1 Tax=Streptomyces sp. NPDC097619 TaxID=3157228 RepID=UPI0033202860
MSSSESGQPLIPQPPATVTALRQALARIAPAALPAFTRELDEAADHSRQGSDLGPLRRFVAKWSVYVHIQRHPGPARALHHWEQQAETADGAGARHAAAEIGRILDAAHTAVGVERFDSL